MIELEQTIASKVQQLDALRAELKALVQQRNALQAQQEAEQAVQDMTDAQRQAFKQALGVDSIQVVEGTGK